MKIVKYVFLLLVLSAIALTVFIATQNGSYTMEEQRVINVPRPVLYNYINEFKNWKNLGILKGADSLATYTYGEKTSGVEASMGWQRNNDTGKISTLAVSENDSISQETTINDLESKLLWEFKDTLKSTKVTLKITGNLTFMEKAQALFKGNINTSYEKNISRGLSNVNAYLVTELRKFDIKVGGQVNKINAYYLGATTEGPVTEAAAAAAAKFDQLYSFAKENKIKVQGAPFIIYKNLNKAEQKAKYTYAIQLTEAIYIAAGSEYESGELSGFRALKTTLKGDYSHLPEAWKKATAYVTEKALPENTAGEYVEIYTKNPAHTPRPSQWQTDIYIPVGKSVSDSLSTQPPLPPINNTTAQPAAPVRTSVKPRSSVPAKPTGTKPAATATTGGTNKPTATPAKTTTKTTPPNTAGSTTTTNRPAAKPKPKQPTTTRSTTNDNNDDMNPPRG